MKTRCFWILVVIGIAGCGFFCRSVWLPKAASLSWAHMAASAAAGKSSPERSGQTDDAEKETSELEALTYSLQAHNYQTVCGLLLKGGAKNPLRWLEWMAAIPEEQRTAARFALLAGWYRAKPAEMLDWAEAHESDFFRSAQFTEAAVESGNFVFALRGLSRIADQEEQADRVEAFFAGCAARDLAQTLKVADSLDPARRHLPWHVRGLKRLACAVPLPRPLILCQPHAPC